MIKSFYRKRKGQFLCVLLLEVHVDIIAAIAGNSSRFFMNNSNINNNNKSNNHNNNISSNNHTANIKTHLTIFGFIRLFIETQFSCIIPWPIKYICCDFYGYAFTESDILTSITDQQLLYELLSTQLKPFDTQLIYQSIKHKTDTKSFYDHCIGKSPTLVLIESGFGNVFGAYSTVPWKFPKIGKLRFKDENAFLFVMKTNDDSNESAMKNSKQKCGKIFPIKKTEVSRALYMYSIGRTYMFHFGAAAGICIVSQFDDNRCRNFCYGKGWTYDLIEYGSELCGMKKGSEHKSDINFDVKQLEVFHIH